jgi:hypothetical protein
MCLWCCWKDLDEKDLMENYSVRFGFRMWGEILIFRSYFSAVDCLLGMCTEAAGMVGTLESPGGD